MSILYRPSIAMPCGRQLPHRAELYHDAVVKAGGVPEFILPGRRPEELLEYFDGFLFPGGKDLPPQLYHEVGSFSVDLEEEDRIAFDFALLELIVRYNRPVFGICYGMQLINVFMGGTLYQDIVSEVPGALDHTKNRHPIVVNSNPLISEGTYEVNSSHHQAIRRPGKRLTPFAFSPDGIIEAFHAGHGSFMAGCQWHPERSPGTLDMQMFAQFISACRMRRA
ncbi:MAG: gamma-glutamyl-gamma-aminobutyrate hydrolase family protein [Thermodesulfovibrionales bacterium]